MRKHAICPSRMSCWGEGVRKGSMLVRVRVSECVYVCIKGRRKPVEPTWLEKPDPVRERERKRGCVCVRVCASQLCGEENKEPQRAPYRQTEKAVHERALISNR